MELNDFNKLDEYDCASPTDDEYLSDSEECDSEASLSHRGSNRECEEAGDIFFSPGAIAAAFEVWHGRIGYVPDDATEEMEARKKAHEEIRKKKLENRIRRSNR